MSTSCRQTSSGKVCSFSQKPPKETCHLKKNPSNTSDHTEKFSCKTITYTLASPLDTEVFPLKKRQTKNKQISASPWVSNFETIPPHQGQLANTHKNTQQPLLRSLDITWSGPQDLLHPGHRPSLIGL